MDETKPVPAKKVRTTQKRTATPPGDSPAPETTDGVRKGFTPRTQVGGTVHWFTRETR